jgi:RimJ/RimL family protein N-acetyltransferase
MTVTVVLRPISAAAAGAILAGRAPDDVRTASDYPTEFSRGIAASAGGGSPLGAFFIHSPGDGPDDRVVGEIGGGIISPGLVEIGYAIVRSCWSRGYATAAVGALIDRARAVSGVRRIVAHNPVDRPASGRVLQKNGFQLIGEIDDQHEGVTLRVQRWELIL